MYRAIKILSVAAVSLLCSQCSNNAIESADPGSPGGSLASISPAERSVLNSSTAFGLRLFREIVETEDDTTNLFISPLSVSMALGMTMNGANGDTWKEMQSTLGFVELSAEEINLAYKNLASLLTQADPDVTMQLAHSIWYPPWVTVRQGFVNLSRTYFDARVSVLDFSLPSAKDTINIWVAGKTNDKIPELLENRIERDIVMILINAIYFNGAWSCAFDPDSTVDDYFTLADGSQSACRMMTREGSLGYFPDSLFEVINLPYGNGDFRMTVFLPKPSVDVGTLAAEFTEENWADWTGNFRDVKTLLQLPKFKIEYGTGLNDVLKRMGMRIPFTTSADFSNMLADGGAWIDTVIHKAFVEVNEQGTEAAAATAVIMERCGPISFRVDRPFIFAIWEKESKSILFLGKVMEPVYD